ncbi:DUF1127 domain-containing protein [Sinorhizobium medicae]|uniref:DUF1127 domain-containing protein n=1 Tax=Sinorhizobium medicae TaxID=110321 RepID=UPI0030876E27|nr:DUF1127 domain-containing protein [Sinorhizobium medicae]
MGAIDTIRPLKRLPPPPVHFDIDPVRNAGNLFSRLWQFYCALAAKRRSRLALDELSTHLLDDIGVSEIPGAARVCGPVLAVGCEAMLPSSLLPQNGSDGRQSAATRRSRCRR